MEKTTIKTDDGISVEAGTPIIVSASRATDIPAFYADWFQERLQKGYSVWKNPFNGVKSYVAYDKTRLIVFWSKNPAPLLKAGGLLDYLDNRSINSYIQFTLNDYHEEKLEMGVPSLSSRMDTFKRLVDRLGYGKVIWRFDPLILAKGLTVDDLLEKIYNIEVKLNGYTEKLVFSFADIASYKKVQNNLYKNNIQYREFSQKDMMEFACGLVDMNKEWKLELATCAEKIDLDMFGIKHNKCIDDELMIKYFSDDMLLMNHLGVEVTKDIFGEISIEYKKNKKDKGQRKVCGCIDSKDIGEYNTCPHLCEYCYANSSKEIAKQNYIKHCENQHNENITSR